MNLPEKIQRKLETLSSRPGVYLMRDRLGRVIYVGKARALNKRVKSYFQASRQNQMDPKTKALVSMVADLDIREVRNETEAILLEGKLIKQYQPRYNILFKDDKRFMLVKLTRETFPRFVLTRLQKPDGCRYFGPFSSSKALRTTLEYLKKNFHIRSCPAMEPDEKDYRHCHNDILKHCAAPCVGRISLVEYQRWVERASCFLEGNDESALEEMEGEMKKAAERKDFEKAAVLRDGLYDLRQTVKQSARKFARDMPRVRNSEGEMKTLEIELGLKGPPRIIEGFDISHIHGRHAVGSMVQFYEGHPARKQYRHFRIRGKNKEGEGGLLREEDALNRDDLASMREIVGRRYQRLVREGKELPDLVLIDGGPTQLAAARVAMQEVGVKLPVIGLAKEEEEIYMPDRKNPLKLEASSPALQLLQRIRDESHRFANSLHEGWRRKQIRSSVLDELPGLGAKRKKALLARFGSLEGIRKASMKELAEVEGVGERMARILVRFLNPDHGQTM